MPTTTFWVRLGGHTDQPGNHSGSGEHRRWPNDAGELGDDQCQPVSGFDDLYPRRLNQHGDNRGHGGNAVAVRDDGDQYRGDDLGQRPDVAVDQYDDQPRGGYAGWG